MCGRYSFAPSQKQQKEQLGDVQFPAEWRLSYNIAPTHRAYVITGSAVRRLESMEWGLVPHWSRDGVNSGKMINARSEGIEEKPSFRDPVRRHRCLVPADSFYEWRHEAGRRKIPYRILRKDRGLMFMAGIWDEWRQGDEHKKTFSIITTTPSADISDLHDRMPVMLNEADGRRWLDDSTPLDAVLSMLHTPPEGELEFYRVSEEINAPGPDHPGLQEEAPETWRLF